MDHPFDAVTLASLRRRRSAKWSRYPVDVLPAWVAEMDYPLAAPIRAVLHAAIEGDDCGYADPAGLGDAFAPWAAATWGWSVAPADVRLVPDVVTGLAELLRLTTAPGDRVVIEPPVYPPFAGTIRGLGREVVTAPLVAGPSGLAPDLDALARAYADGARVHVLCSPHNPTGYVYPRATLAALGELAARHDVLVISDEIHAPLTLAGATHVPFPMASPAAAAQSIVLTSASKTWNLAGLKAAVAVAGGARGRAILGRMPLEVGYHAGHLGILAARAAFTAGEPWRARTLAILGRNRALLGELLAHHLPAIGYAPPAAGYLAWLDCRALGLGDDPAAAFLATGRVALSPGPSFGDEGRGWARLNVATTAALLEEIVVRLARTVAGHAGGR